MSRQQWGFMAVMVLGVVAGCAPPEQPECTYATLSGNLMSCDTEADWARTRTRFLELRRKGIGGMTRSEHLDFKRAAYNLAAKMIEQETLWFTVSGEIVDEEGNPLEDVQMTVTDRWPVPWFVKIAEIKYMDRGTPRWIRGAYRASMHSRAVTVNKTFSASSQGAPWFVLSFEKKGRRSSSIGFPRENRTRSLEGHLERGTIEPGKLAKDGIRVVLKKSFKDVTLKKLYSYLPTVPTGKVGYVDYDSEYIGSQKRRRAEKMPPKEMAFLADKQKVPAGRIWATIPVDSKTGVFRTTLYKKPNERSPSYRGRNIVTGLTLHASGTVAGFVRFKPTAMRKHQDYVWREMRSAPEQGYRSELTIEAVDIPKLYNVSGDAEKCYFYFRSEDGKYGKCCVSVNRASKDNKRVELCLELYMQPDGSRNVQTNGTPRQ